jgi:hypothetical protein
MGKHGKVKPGVERRANLWQVKIEQGYGVGRYGKGGYGVGEQRITFRLNDGIERDAYEFATSVLEKWEHVFEGEG